MEPNILNKWNRNEEQLHINAFPLHILLQVLPTILIK
jgi:hypothetical protein